ncbi:MAG: DUF1003 domain-containing protein [Planctomycetes bacterium]|nr:DUF1003 domain-containing protein [Planctomycetota bacterium]
MSQEPGPSTKKPGDERAPCSVCGTSHRIRTLLRTTNLRPGLAAYLACGRDEGWVETARICRSCQAHGRHDMLVEQLESERGQLSAVEREIADKAARHLTLAEDIEREFAATTTWGQRLADRVSQIGGSWPFVIWFFAVMLVWVVVNGVMFTSNAFDPYPFILLNLLLSCLAAVQAPIIMMSQNRMNQRDRRQADQDFRVNLKAEIEVATLHEKVDHLLHAQWNRMVELQQLQLDLLQELARRRGSR